MIHLQNERAVGVVGAAQTLDLIWKYQKRSK